MTESTVLSKAERIFSTIRGPLLTALMGCLAFDTQAAVQVTRFDPPRNISAYAEVSADSYFNILGADLDANGEVDFRLAYGLGGISAFYNAPLRFAQRVPQPNMIGKGGPVAGVPLGSIIGTNIASSIATNFYVWSPGYSNRYDLTQSLGDHEEVVLTAGWTQGFPGTNIIFFSTGTLVTNIIYPQPFVSGDVVGKDAVMALEFYVDGQRHYGYIHCDFRGGGPGGIVYGWAYETEPNTPIEAVPLSPIKKSKGAKPAMITPVRPPVMGADKPLRGPALVVDLATRLSGIVGSVNENGLLGWTVSVSTKNGSFVTSVQTDDDGFFRVNLKPGLYVVHAFFMPHPGPGEPVPNFVIKGPAQSVIVTKRHFTSVELLP